MMEDAPKLDLLILGELLEPTDRALEVLADIRTDMQTHGSSPLGLAGLFVLAISQAEIALVDSTLYILGRNPWRMNFSKLEIKRDDLLSTELTRDLLEKHAENLVRSWAYGPGDQLVRRFLTVAGIDDTRLATSADCLSPFRKRRNELLHQGPHDSGWRGTRNWITGEELATCLSNTEGFLTAVSEELRRRYEGYTRVAALKRLWSYLFDSPIMDFDEFWHVDDGEDKVLAFKDNPLVDQLSTSERILLGLWRAEFAGDPSLLREFSMKRLDADRRRDLVTLIAALREIWLY